MTKMKVLPLQDNPPAARQRLKGLAGCGAAPGLVVGKSGAPSRGS
jgi:hypothetical protein